MQTKLVLKQQSALKLRFQPGATGPAGTITVGTVTTGAPGSSVIVTNSGTPENAILDFTIPEGEQGIPGLTGNKGWSPVFAIVSDGARRVLQVDDWVGGEGVKPATGDYVGATGLTPTIGDAIDIRGPAGTATIPDGNKGDITTSAGGDAWEINNDAVSNAELANMATARIKGRSTAGTGDPEDLSGSEATALLDAMVGDSGSGGTKGLAPAPAAGDAAAGKVLGAGGGWVFPGIAGQCRLVKSSSNIVLQPLNGNLLTIGGVTQVIPNGGVSLAPTGLTAGTLYSIYAYMNSGTMTLEASTTGHATDSATGVEIKSGDSTRTLVGAARPITGPAWQDTEAQRFVLSYFNQRSLPLFNKLTSNATKTSTTYTEASTAFRMEFLTWGGTIATADIGSWTTNNTAGAINYLCVGVDGSVPASGGRHSASSGGTVAIPTMASFLGVLSEGYHYFTLMVRSTTGTLTVGGASADDGNANYAIGQVQG